jgi:hypothetical protein
MVMERYVGEIFIEWREVKFISNSIQLVGCLHHSEHLNT